MTHAHTHSRADVRMHTHGANYNLPPASWAGDNIVPSHGCISSDILTKIVYFCQFSVNYFCFLINISKIFNLV